MQQRYGGDGRRWRKLSDEQLRGRRDGGRGAACHARRAMGRVGPLVMRGGMVHGRARVISMVVVAAMIVGPRRARVVVTNRHANARGHRRHALQGDGERHAERDKQAKDFDGHQFRILPYPFDAPMAERFRGRERFLRLPGFSEGLCHIHSFNPASMPATHAR